MFEHRVDAGRRLAALLDNYRSEDAVVVGLPRGGVPVAAEVARAIGAPLDVIVVRKLGTPSRPELAMGAIGEEGARVVEEHVVAMMGITERDLDQVERRERRELDRRSELFRAAHPAVPLDGRVVIVVDDGIATGSTARAACQVARAHGASRVVLAVPVAPLHWYESARDVADEFVVVDTPRDFHAVGEFYRDFDQTTDREVIELLQASRAGARHGSPSDGGTATEVEIEVEIDVEIEIGTLRLPGKLVVPPSPIGVVVFAHGSGSSRLSPRNEFVASVLNEAGLATLLFDLLTDQEAADRANVFDIELLAGRLREAGRTVRAGEPAGSLPLGYFGASTGAAAALVAASDDAEVRALVSRGGRPDLAGHWLPTVTAPTLLIVGDQDREVLRLNRHAQTELRCENRLATVPGATHLFDEPGTLRAAAELARDWFVEHLAALSGA
jgi:putative phosphoribosyl transferase